MNILITSVGRRSYLVQYFKDALNGKGKVHVMNSTKISPAFRVADYAVESPLIYSDEYIPFLLNYCKENDINLLISLFDIDVLVLSKNKEKFAEIGVHVISADQEFVEICNDKWKTYNFLIQNDFLAPKTYLSKESFFNDVNNGIVNYPVIVKPRWGMGSLSIYQADNLNELEIFYEKIKKEVKNSYLKYEAIQDENNAILIQEKINGQEYGIDVINDLKGNYIDTIVKKKYAMRSGETDCAEIMDNEELQDLGKRISSLSKHEANLDVDLFLSEDGVYVLEMNARFGGGYPFSHAAGVNLPLAIVKWENGEEVSKTLLKAKPGFLGHKDINVVEL